MGITAFSLLWVMQDFYHQPASIRYIDLLKGSYNSNYPPENVLDEGADEALKQTVNPKPSTS